MVSINLHQPGKLNAYIQFPSRWEELLPYELLKVARWMLLPPIARQGMLFFLIESRARMQKISLFKGWKDALNMDDAVAQGLPLLDFLYSSNELTVVPERVIKPSTFSPKLYGPADAFESITCGEFEDCEQYFNTFSSDPNPEPLSLIAAALWRPKNVPYLQYKKGHWITYDAAPMAKRLLKLAPNRLFAIYLWYTGCRSQLPFMFPTMYEGSTKKVADDEPVDLMVFTKCIHAGAGDRNGTREAIRRMKLQEFMFDMEQEAIKAKELKALYDEQRKPVH